jgi:DNA-binding IscR family transcriptional regulator
VFLEVRDAAAKILENTTLADLISREPAGSRPNARSRKTGKKKKNEPSVLPLLVQGEGHD